MTSASVGRVAIAMPERYRGPGTARYAPGMTAHEFVARIVEEEGGPEPELRDRFAVVVGYRLGQLEDQQGVYPKAGDRYDFMDAFEGPYVWEMTDAEFEATPPTLVDFEVVDVDPAEPAESGTVRVTARIPF